jgi:hypothetical protein
VEKHQAGPVNVSHHGSNTIDSSHGRVASDVCIICGKIGIYLVEIYI